jgi:ABC-type uncharacterized transport system permease subunit
MFVELQEKFRQWLQLTYSMFIFIAPLAFLTYCTVKEELHRQSPAMVSEPQPLGAP